ncbi:MAG: ABC transporter permease [Chitinophagaceae bacterium]|nr:MAG: lipoprotein release ABC transporter permease [Bacteroidetes bacterium OLB11]MCC6447564.1 ABC transporter permease [Chitinophagaceae bacterium]HMN32878.1 FtsX-like permease family protein [Chitinophagaceae bacterium]
MNLGFFIANRIAFHQKKSFSAFIVRIAIAAITLSTSVMIIGTAITKGYQKVISEKFYDCWGNLQITNYLRDESHILNDDKIEIDSSIIHQILALKGVNDVHTYTVQSALMKTKEGIEGVIIKGIDNAQTRLLSPQYLIDGKAMQFKKGEPSNEIIISKTIADKLSFKVQDQVILYFLNKNEYTPKARKVTIVGIYNTAIEDYDKHFILADQLFLGKINGEDANVIQGYEIYLKNKNYTLSIKKEIEQNIIDAPLEIYTLEQRFSNIFSWLEMMKMNERIIVIIMLAIASINMITAFLILVMERIPMIGVLKSLGMTNQKIRSIFFVSSFYIISLGVLMGAVLGIGACLIQQHFGIFSLNESVYFIKKVPIYIHLPTLFSIIIGTIILCLSIMILPAIIIRKISPTKAIRFS